MRANTQDIKNLNEGKVVIKRDKKFTYIMLADPYKEEIKDGLNGFSDKKYYYQPIPNEDFIDAS